MTQVDFTRFVSVSVITKWDFAIKGTNRFVRGHTFISKILLGNLSMKRNSHTLIGSYDY